MSRLFFALSLVVLLGFGCSATTPDSPTNTADVTNDIELQSDAIYVAFIINVHDFSQPEQSITAVNKIIDLHEQYQLPVDIYLDDAMVQVYEEQSPALIERLKSSQYVAVSYHLRPPTPYYAGFHKEWFDGLQGSDLEDALRNYEMYRTDLTTGKTTTEAGGYQHLKDVLGYAPYVVTEATGKSELAQALASVYRDLGAKFVLRHGVASNFGQSDNGLYLRPENAEVKVYEPRKTVSPEQFYEDGVSQLTATRPAFINFKWHENNFYSSGTNWAGIYYAPGQKGSVPLDPPYDLSLWMTSQTDKSDTEEALQWTRYEEMLKYTQDHTSEYTAVNSREVLNFLE